MLVKAIKTLIIAATLSIISPIAGAVELIDDYYAYIGRDDLYNSKGGRLTEAWQVIRQDRANYHRFGIRQREDQNDSFFSSKRNRAIAERMIMNGHISKTAANDIVRGGVFIHVEIFGEGNTGTYLNVTVEE